MTARRWVSLTLKILEGCALLVGSLILIASCTPVTQIWASALANPWYDSGSCETLIVLGGSDLEDDLLGYSSYWRSVYAVRAHRAHSFKRILISGGSHKGTSPAESMSRFLVASGIPAEIIILESESTSTRENALFTERLIGAESGCKDLMTSDLHIYRASRAFRRAGMDVRATPVPDALKKSSRWHQRWLVMIELASETGRIAYYKLRRWI